MILKIGNKALTLIEVLVAVAILSFGIVGIIRAYVTSLHAMQAAQEYIDEVTLAKTQMAQMQLEALGQGGLSIGHSQGGYKAPYNGFGWQVQVAPSQQKDLNVLAVEVLKTAPASGRQVSLMTYVDNKE